MAATNASQRFKDKIRGSIVDKEAADAIIELHENFNDVMVALDALQTKFNAVLTKLDADGGVTDTDYNSLHASSTTFESSYDVDVNL